MVELKEQERKHAQSVELNEEETRDKIPAVELKEEERNDAQEVELKEEERRDEVPAVELKEEQRDDDARLEELERKLILLELRELLLSEDN